MHPESADPSALAPRRDAWLLAALAFGLYAVLGQETLFNRDAHILLLRLGEGKPMHNHHFTYFPVVHLVHALASPFGLILYESARLASAIGTALGVLFVHFACRTLGLPRGRAALTTALVAVCPAVVFFATVVEVHGPFFTAAGLACWATARLVRKPATLSAVLVGGAMGLAYCAHATANLLPAVLLPLAFAELRRARPDLRLRRFVELALLAVAVHGMIVLTVPAALGWMGMIVRTTDAFYIIRQPLEMLMAKPGWGWRLPELAAIETYKEWLLPMVPLSVVFLAGFWRRELRLQTGLLVLGLLPYLALVTVVLHVYPNNSEHGAYLLPLVWPAALLITAALPRAWSIGVVVLSLVIAVADVKSYDEPERSRDFAAGLLEHAGDRPPYLLVCDYADLEAIHIHMPEIGFVFLGEFLPGVRGPEALGHLDWAVLSNHREGGAVYLSEGTVTQLEAEETAPFLPAARVAMEHLRKYYNLVRVDLRGFHGYHVVPR